MALTLGRGTPGRGVEEAPDAPGRILDGPRVGVEVGLRWVLIHMVEEYARHNGHADILRESIDGMTGA
ncbi:mycothiol transferase [Streptomyces sp. NPDC001100]